MLSYYFRDAIGAMQLARCDWRNAIGAMQLAQSDWHNAIGAIANDKIGAYVVSGISNFS